MVKVKKISYLSSLILVVASTIGAGIFFKNRELAGMSQGNVGLVIATWAIAIVGIFALGMALIEISNVKTSTRGILGWTKQFCPRWFHKASINYQKYFFIPITLFALSLYVVSTFVDAGWNLQNGWLVLLVAFAIFSYFMIINLLSLKLVEFTQWITTLLQLIPLFALPVIALINVGSSDLNNFKNEYQTSHGINGLGSWIVLLGGLPAIFFAYDGFYTVAELKSDLQKPHKIGKTLCYGLIIISLVYIFLTIAFNLGSTDGTHNGITNLSPWIKNIFNCLIAVGIMGIINGYALSSPRLYQTMIKENEGWDLRFFHKKWFNNSNNARHQFITSWIYLFATTTLFFIVFGCFGMLMPLGNWDYQIYGSGGQLYELADIVLNYSSLLIFVIIVTTILGYLIKRKKHYYNNKKTRFFKFYSIMAICLFYFSLGFILVGALINVTGFNGADIGKETLKLIIFLGVIIGCIIPTLFNSKKTIVEQENIEFLNQ